MILNQESRERVLDLLGAGVELPRLTAVGSELLSILHMPLPDIDMHRVVSLVESDPALTATVLRMANSAYYGALREIRTVAQAVPRMGLEDAIHILSYHCLHGMMPASRNLPHFSSREFWLHSWATAAVARMLSRPQYLLRALPGELYTAGLLHDIGKIVLAGHFGDAFDQACAAAGEKGIPLHEAEVEIMGIDHTAIGVRLLDDWNLPRPILDAVSGHHDPMLYKPEAHEIAMLIELADALAHHCGFGDGTGQRAPDPLRTAIASQSNYPLAVPQTLQRLIEEIPVRLKDKVRLLQKQNNSRPEAEIGSGEPWGAAKSVPPQRAHPVPRRSLWRRLTDGIRDFIDS
jgi:putative nucleotidyltransferase with HDIG domain